MKKEEQVILYEWNNVTKEFWFLGEKIDYVHNPEEWRKHLNNLVTQNQKLKYNWNELRKMIEKTIIALHETAINPDDEFITTSKGTFARVLNMMEELEKESDINE